MQVTKDSNDTSADRRAVTETVVLVVVFLIAVFLFIVTVHFIATREAAYELQNRPRGLIMGWLTAIAIGLMLGRTRQAADTVLPKSLMMIRGSIQALMLLLFAGVLGYASYFLYTVRGLALQRPWSLLVGWFAFLVCLAGLGKIRQLVRALREESYEMRRH